MNKTLTINLGGRMFHVDEDAYKLLYDYLYNLRHAFEKQEGGNEILDDLENRLAELLLEQITNRQEVVSHAIVEEAIKLLGKPEEIAGEDEAGDEPHAGTDAGEAAPEEPQTSPQEGPKASAGEHTEQAKEAETSEKPKAEEAETHQTQSGPVRKRLFRNPDDRMLGGVLGGLAVYLNWDPTLLRLLLVIILIAGYGTVIPIYVVCWLVIPKAVTAADKLSMKGQPITMENIGKVVTNGIDNVGEYLKSDKPRSTFQRIADGLVQFIGILFKIILVILAICCSPFLLALCVLLLMFIVATGALFIGGTASLAGLYPELFSYGSIPGLSLACYLCGIVGAILILACFISSMFSLAFKWKGFPPRVMKALLITAVVCLIGAGVCAILTGFQLFPINAIMHMNYL